MRRATYHMCMLCGGGWVYQPVLYPPPPPWFLPLPGHDLGDGMSDGDAGPLDLLPGQARGEADLQRRLGDEDLVFGPQRVRGHALLARDQDALGQTLENASSGQ